MSEPETNTQLQVENARLIALLERPLHLIEGTHRVSYLRHMLITGRVLPSSTHQFVVLSPHETDA